MSDIRRKTHGQNQSHYGKWNTDENGIQWYVCSTQIQETQKKTKKLGGEGMNPPGDIPPSPPPVKKLTIDVPEDGCGGDDPQQGFLMKGLETPQAPRHSVIEPHLFHDSSQLPTYRDVYTRESWEKHIEMICECVQNGTLQQESLNEEEFKEAYKYATGR